MWGRFFNGGSSRRDRFAGDDPDGGYYATAEPYGDGYGDRYDDGYDDDYLTETHPAPHAKARGRKRKWAARLVALFLFLLILAVGWLAITAPLSKSLEPIAPPQITLTASDGTPIARNGAITEEPVAIDTLPQHTIDAFLSIEDRRFYSHWGVDPRGLARAAWGNATSDRTQGGSTITQQLAKFTFLTPEQTHHAQGPRNADRILAGGLADEGRNPGTIFVQRLFRGQSVRSARGVAALFLSGAGKSDAGAIGHAGRVGASAVALRPVQTLCAGEGADGRRGGGDGGCGPPDAGARASGAPARHRCTVQERTADRNLFRGLGPARSAQAGAGRLRASNDGDDTGCAVAAIREIGGRQCRAGRRASGAGGHAPVGRSRRHDRRYGLYEICVQPRDPGEAAARLDVQAVRLSRSLARRGAARTIRSTIPPSTLAVTGRKTRATVIPPPSPLPMPSRNRATLPPSACSAMSAAMR